MQKEVRKFGFSDKRGRAKTSEDPYISDEGHKGTLLCETCHAIYQNKRWYLDKMKFKKLESSGEGAWTTCPGCQKVAERYAEGVLTLRGDYLWDHEEEIRNIVQNEAERAQGRNPLERIIHIGREGNELVIQTTEEKLAESLGKVLHRSHQGALDITYDDDHALCRVTWERPG